MSNQPVKLTSVWCIHEGVVSQVGVFEHPNDWEADEPTQPFIDDENDYDDEPTWPGGSECARDD